VYRRFPQTRKSRSTVPCNLHSFVFDQFRGVDLGLFSVLAFWGALALLACPPRLSTALRSGFALTRLRLLAHSPGVRV
jgi:hypothetical protein